MSERDEPLASVDSPDVAAARPAPGRAQLRPLLVGLPVLALITGVLFPLALALPCRVLMPHRAGGSLVTRDGTVVGSETVGQEFAGPRYFHSRPSAAGGGYDAAASGGTNLGPAHPKLLDGDADFPGVLRLAAEYRTANGLPASEPVPIDAVTRSGSGLDPHISPANAELQAGRVARARNLGLDEVRKLVAEHTRGRQLGFLGEPRVNVLTLNIALDGALDQAAGR